MLRLFIFALACTTFSSCTIAVNKDLEPQRIGEPERTGKWKSTGNYDATIAYDSENHTIKTSLASLERPEIGQKIRTPYQSCKRQDFVWPLISYIYGGIGSAAGLGLTIGGAVDGGTGMAVGGGVLLAASVGLLVGMGIWDAQHDDDELYDCQDIGRYHTETETKFGEPESRRKTDYSVALATSGRHKQYFTPDASGEATINLWGPVFKCPGVVPWKASYEMLPGIGVFRKSIGIGVGLVVTKRVPVKRSYRRRSRVYRRGAYRKRWKTKKTVVAKKTFHVKALDLDRYLRAQARAIGIEARRGPSVLPILFTLEDKNSRIPVKGAQISVRVLSKQEKRGEVRITPQAKEFAERLSDLDCRADELFYEYIRQLAYQAERELDEGRTPSCRFEQGECQTISDGKGQIRIWFYPNTKVHIEIRKTGYYFLSLDLTVGKTEPSWDRKQRNKIVRDRFREGYTILLQDVGQRIRRGD